jgi:hypothetical protein
VRYRKKLIRIRIETNADPKHWFSISPKGAGHRDIYILASKLRLRKVSVSTSKKILNRTSRIRPSLFAYGKKP